MTSSAFKRGTLSVCALAMGLSFAHAAPISEHWPNDRPPLKAHVEAASPCSSPVCIGPNEVEVLREGEKLDIIDKSSDPHSPRLGILNPTWLVPLSVNDSICDAAKPNSCFGPNALIQIYEIFKNHNFFPGHPVIYTENHLVLTMRFSRAMFPASRVICRGIFNYDPHCATHLEQWSSDNSSPELFEIWQIGLIYSHNEPNWIKWTEFRKGEIDASSEKKFTFRKDDTLYIACWGYAVDQNGDAKLIPWSAYTAEQHLGLLGITLQHAH